MYTHAIIETSYYYGAKNTPRLARGERGESLLYESLAGAQTAARGMASTRIGSNESSPPTYRVELISRLSARLRDYL